MDPKFASHISYLDSNPCFRVVWQVVKFICMFALRCIPHSSLMCFWSQRAVFPRLPCQGTSTSSRQWKSLWKSEGQEKENPGYLCLARCVVAFTAAATLCFSDSAPQRGSLHLMAQFPSYSIHHGSATCMTILVPVLWLNIHFFLISSKTYVKKKKNKKQPHSWVGLPVY